MIQILSESYEVKGRRKEESKAGREERKVWGGEGEIVKQCRTHSRKLNYAIDPRGLSKQDQISSKR